MKTQKRKSSLKIPYHGRKRHLNVPVMVGGERKCMHALAHHEVLTDQRGKQVTVSYALPCVVGHKPTTKNPQHRDASKGTWK